MGANVTIMDINLQRLAYLDDIFGARIQTLVSNDANIEKTPKELPLLIASGNADPVGEYGKAVERIYNKYKKHMEDVELKLYDGCRHELHSEINAQEVFEDIYNWIVERVG